ncbi:MAG: hypothetical protein JNL74_06315 [Fibrobacteres bacterium]|nr:hypothetical protein [Fibrobacterota bacterium]
MFSKLVITVSIVAMLFGLLQCESSTGGSVNRVVPVDSSATDGETGASP